MPQPWRKRKALTIIAVACGVAIAASIVLAYPEPVFNPTLGAGWQCHRAAGIILSCSRISRAEPMTHRPRPVPVDFRRV